MTTIRPKLLVAGLVLAAALAAYAYPHFSGATRSTENAYLSADVVNVAAQVGGRVIAVHAQENQRVHQGDALFDLDPAPFAIALARAEAELAQAQQTARQDRAEIGLAQAQLAQVEHDLAHARRNEARNQALLAQHFVSPQALDDAHAQVQSLQAALEQARARLNKARAAPEPSSQRGDVLKAQAAIAQAKLELAQTRITAAQDGQISNLSLRPGSLVTPGIPLFALIDERSFHIDANFKETELVGIQAGQRVDVQIDMYPGETFQGTVDSFSGGTGTAFSLLPPQNATGNWVKIAQRVPVRIQLAPLSANHPLRIGATATVTVHLR